MDWGNVLMERILLNAKVKAILKNWYPELDLDEVKIVRGGVIAWFFGKFFNAAAVTVGRTIYLTEKSYWKPSDPYNVQGLSLLIHELWHVKQQKEAGTARWLSKYILDWIASGFRTIPFLPLELPAYEAQRKFLESAKGV